MPLTLNHTIVWCRDKEVSARFLAETLGLPAPRAWGNFLQVAMNNQLTLDFCDADDPNFRDSSGNITPQHYAFLVSEEEFDPIFGRIRARGQEYWAHPARKHPGRISRFPTGGRGVFFEDPDRHWLEVITKPYVGTEWNGVPE